MMTYEQWIAKVDRVLQNRIGLTHEDLADFCSADCWEDEMSPEEGAEECLLNDDTYASAVEEGLI